MYGFSVKHFKKLSQLNILLILQLFFSNLAIADSNHWQPFNTGIDNLGHVWTVAFHVPHPNELFAAVDHDGLYQSSDNGKTWNKISNEALNGSRITGIVFNPKNENEMYVSNSRGLYHSADHGKTWQTLLFVPDDFISAIAINPDLPSELYLLKIDGEVLKSKDNGKSWNLLLDTEFQYRKISINPLNPNHVIIFATKLFSSDSFLFQSTNGGQSWEKLNIKQPNNFAFSPKDKNQLYVPAEQGLMRSDDLGKTWFLVFKTPENKANAILINDTNSDEMFLNVQQTGIYKTEDGGKNWHLIDATFKNDQYMLPTLLMNPAHDGVFLLTDHKGLWYGDHHGEDWYFSNVGIHALSVESLAIDPINNHIGYAGTDEGLWIMNDGKTWMQEAKLGQVHSIIINQLQTSRMVIQVYDNILYSDDSGKTWNHPLIQYGDAKEGRYQMQGVAYQPSNPNAMFALMNYQAVSGGQLETFVSKSTDSGRTWLPVSRINEKTLWLAREAAIAINPKNINEMYLGILDDFNGVFLYKSEDGGKSWKLLPYQFKKLNYERLRESKITLKIDLSNPATLYFIYANLIYKSFDSGATWVEMHQGLPEEKNFNAMTLDPHNANRLFLGAANVSPNASSKLNDSQNIFISNDGGASWMPFTEGLIIIE